VPGDRLPDGCIAGTPRRVLDRRSFLAGSGAALAVGGFALGRATEAAPRPAVSRASPIQATATTPPSAPALRAGDWESVRAQFEAPSADVHLNGFVLAVPPLPVRNAVETYRARLDVDGIDYLERTEASIEDGVRQAAARYLGSEPERVALTDSTTMGLGIVYGAARLRPGDELVASVHDFYATQEAMRFAALRAGATRRLIALYERPRDASSDALVERALAAVGPRTRILGVTWVHSSSGIRFPVEALAKELGAINAGRSAAERVLLVVDGVHGLGADRVRVADLGCDVFVSGCHKWLYGPRGTGLVWANADVSRRFVPVIPTFDLPTYEAWREGHPVPAAGARWSGAMSPGGFHSFENRWALADAFDFHEQLGRRTIATRIATLTERLRQGLSELANVEMVSPDEPALRSSIVCFLIKNVEPQAAVERLSLKGIRISLTPYRDVYLRAGCPLWVDEAGIDRALRAVRAL